MTPPNSPHGDGHDFDWKRAEAELNTYTTDPDAPSAEVVELDTRRRRTDSDLDTRPDTTPGPAPDNGEVLEGELLPPAGADLAYGPPELKQWAWAVGWRHKARRFWTYRYRYLWNTAVVLGAWSARVGGVVVPGYRPGRPRLRQLPGRPAGPAGREPDRRGRRRPRRRGRLAQGPQRAAPRGPRPPQGRPHPRSRCRSWPGPCRGRAAGVARARRLALAATSSRGPRVAWMAAGCWLVWYGRTRTAPFWPTFREPSPYPPVSMDTVTGALLATGIVQLRELVKNGHSPVDVIYRDDTAGGKIAETHPVPGVTTDMLMSKAVVIAGALRRPPAMVHLSQAPSGVPGHVELLVLDIDPGTLKPRPYAYLQEGA